MPEARINELREVEADLATVQDHAALLLNSRSQKAVDIAGQRLVVEELRQCEMPSQLVGLVLVLDLLAPQS